MLSQFGPPSAREVMNEEVSAGKARNAHSAYCSNLQKRCANACLGSGFSGCQELSCSLVAPIAHSTP